MDSTAVHSKTKMENRPKEKDFFTGAPLFLCLLAIGEFFFDSSIFWAVVKKETIVKEKGRRGPVVRKKARPTRAAQGRGKDEKS